MAPRAEILTSLTAAEEIAPAWDRLAVMAGSPYSTPGWALAWARRVGGAEGGPRVAVAKDGGRIVGIAPLWAETRSSRRSEQELLGNRLGSPCDVLLGADAPPGTMAALASALGSATPRIGLLRIEGLARDGSGRRLAEAWPGGGARMVGAGQRPLPLVAIEGLTFDAWLAGRQRNFRSQARRFRRRLEEDGNVFELVAREDLAGAVADFQALHGARREIQGGSNALVVGLASMLEDLAEVWEGEERLRVYRCRGERGPVAVLIAIAAGGVVEAWNSGFDERWAKFSPSIQLALHAIADSCEREEKVVRLGGGAADYKRRLADRFDTLSQELVIPRDAHYPLTRLRLAPGELRRSVGHRLSDETKDKLRRFDPR